MIPLQVIGNALLLWVAYYWLGIGEANAGELLWSALVALAIAGAACWLHGAAFAYFGKERQLRPAAGNALRHLPALLAAAAAIGGVYLLLDRGEGWSAGGAFRTASYLTLKLRTPVKPSMVAGWFHGALAVLRWIAVPVLALPMFAGIASRGWAGFGDFGARVRQWRYWLATPVLALAALWAPFRIYDWVPHVAGFRLEMTSFVLRVVAGYVLFLGAWLTLVFMTSRERRSAQ